MVQADAVALEPEERERLLREIEAEELRRSCSSSFRNFLQHWQFVNRETGEIRILGECLWPGQDKFVDITQEHKWILALKAGKLGFTELECAYDAYVALFGPANARVHIFSRSDTASVELLEYIRFGLSRLPEAIRPNLLSQEAGGDTTHSLRFRLGPEDLRRIVCYPAGPHVSVDQSAQHAHVDELARMPFPDKTWPSVYSTIAPNGSCHIVTRGAGDADLVSSLWESAVNGSNQLYPFFQPWNARERPINWYQLQEGSMPTESLDHFAPLTPEDALRGGGIMEFIPLALWDRCEDPDLPPFLPGDNTPCVLGVDAAVTGDCFGIVAVTRHPLRHDEVAVRACRKWEPQGGYIDFKEPESFIRFLCQGGCAAGHPHYPPFTRDDCEACQNHTLVPGYNIIQVAYDPYQLESLCQNLRRERIAWVEPFPQQRERMIADSELRDLIVNRRIWHTGDKNLREHMQNAAMKISREEDTKLRIVKKSMERKVDLCVALSMAANRILWMVL